MKKLTYYVLTCAIITSHSTISRAIDADLAPDELNRVSRPTISRVADPDPDPDELNQERPSAIGVTEEGERDGVLYMRRSHLRKILLSRPGTYETKGHSYPELNGYKYVRLNNEAGKKEIYLLVSSFEKGDTFCFPKGKKLVPCPIRSRSPKIPAWGVEVEEYIKKKSSKKKSSRGKHRSKKTKKDAVLVDFYKKNSLSSDSDTLTDLNRK